MSLIGPLQHFCFFARLGHSRDAGPGDLQVHMILFVLEASEFAFNFSHASFRRIQQVRMSLPYILQTNTRPLGSWVSCTEHSCREMCRYSFTGRYVPQEPVSEAAQREVCDTGNPENRPNKPVKQSRQY